MSITILRQAGLLACTAITLAGCGTATKTQLTPPSSSSLAAIEVAAKSSSVCQGNRTQLTALGVLADGTKVDITRAVAWSAGGEQVARIDGTELLTISAGTVDVVAILEGIVGRASVAVVGAKADSLQITPAGDMLPLGSTVQLRLTGTCPDGTAADASAAAEWTASGTAVTVSPTGLLTTVARGSAQLQAKAAGVTREKSFTVTAPVVGALRVSPTGDSLAVGYSRYVHATAVLTDETELDVTTIATWTSLDPTIVSVNNGLMKAVGEGTGWIRASLNGITGTAVFLVTPATLMSLQSSWAGRYYNIPIGWTHQVTVKALYSDETTRDVTFDANWTSANPEWVSVEDGLITSLGGAGSVVLTAKYEETSVTLSITVKPATTQISVTPTSNNTVQVGASKKLGAWGGPAFGADVADIVTWSSSDSSVALVQNDGPAAGCPDSWGCVVGIAPGTASICATKGALSGCQTVTVIP